MAWDYYTDGQFVGPLKIMHLIEPGKSQPDTRYECAWRCCGAHVEVSHHLIVARVRRGVERCEACNRREHSANHNRLQAARVMSKEPNAIRKDGWTREQDAVLESFAQAGALTKTSGAAALRAAGYTRTENAVMNRMKVLGMRSSSMGLPPPLPVAQTPAPAAIDPRRPPVALLAHWVLNPTPRMIRDYLPMGESLNPPPSLAPISPASLGRIGRYHANQYPMAL